MTRSADLLEPSIETTRAEFGAMLEWQRVAGRGPWPGIARGLSHFGEHSLGWLALSLTGVLLDRPRRRIWTGVGVGAFVAHAAAVVLKRVVRRRRPSDPRIRILTPTPSNLSFPSAHAASTTAAAVALVPVVGRPAAALVVTAMGLSRVLLGVHYPTDVLAGVMLGLVTGVATRELTRRS